MMEVYLPDTKNRMLRHRIVFEDLIFIESLDENSMIYMTRGRTLLVEMPIEKLYDWFFKRQAKNLMRTHAEFIVNTHHIISAEESKTQSYVTLHLSDGYRALLRKSHEYAFFIQNGYYKKKDSTTHCDIKDAIIMGDIKDVHQIMSIIKKTLGEDVSHRYITARYKQLKQSEYVNKS